jgi:hypothetical protein
VAICEAGGIAHRPWGTFDDVTAWLDEELARFASDPSSLPGPVVQPLFCGPEVRGPQP